MDEAFQLLDELVPDDAVLQLPKAREGDVPSPGPVPVPAAPAPSVALPVSKPTTSEAGGSEDLDDAFQLLDSLVPDEALTGKPLVAEEPVASELDKAELDILDSELDEVVAEADSWSFERAPPDPRRKDRSFADLAVESVKRSFQQTHAHMVAAGGLATHVAGGDGETQVKRATELLGQASVPSYGSITAIHDMEDFFRWGTERMGEQVAVFMTMAATGGIGGFTANLVGRGMLMNAASRHALLRFGQMSGAAAGVFPIESGATAAEIYGDTKKFLPGTAIVAGAGKTALELVLPWHLVKSFQSPTSTLFRSTVEGFVKESPTEGLQESIDILARKWAEPSTFDIFTGKNALRVIDSMAAGGVVGPGYSAIAHGAGKLAGKKPEDSQRELTDEELALVRSGMEFENKDSWSNPLKWLRDTFWRGKVQPLEVDTIPAIEDLSEMSSILSGVRSTWERAGATDRWIADIQDFEDATTERYVVKDLDGSWGTRVMTDTELEQYLATQPQDVKPELAKVDVRTMQAVGITADVYDMPMQQDSGRVYTLPGTTDPTLMQDYEQFRKDATHFTWARLSEAQHDAAPRQRDNLELTYNELLKRGLRVIPSYGSSFYYNGQVIGEAVEVPTTTGRSDLMLEPSGLLTKDTTFKSKGSLAEQEGTIALDLNKVRFEDGIYIPAPMLIADLILNPDPANFSFRKDITDPVEQQRLVDEYLRTWMATPDPTNVSTSMHAQGVMVDPGKADKRQVDALFPEKSVWVSLSPSKMEPRHFTFGVGKPESAKRSAKNLSRPAQVRKVGRFELEISPGAGKSEVDVANKVAPLIKKAMPKVRRLMKSLGLQPNINVRLSTFSTFHRSSYSRGKHEVLIQVTDIISDKFKTTDELTALDILFHELGHGITFMIWDKLPVHVQERVLSGYRKALLNGRITGKSYKSHHIFNPEYGPFQAEYSLTFSEYLAEQFRRWAFTGARAISTVEQFWVDGGKAIKQLGTEYANAQASKLTPQEINDMMEPSWEFTQMMEYVEGMAASPNHVPIRLVDRAMQLPENPQLPVNLKGIEELSSGGLKGLADHLGGEPTEPSTGDLLRMWTGALQIIQKEGSRQVAIFEFVQAAWKQVPEAMRRATILAANRAGIKVQSNVYERGVDRAELSAENTATKKAEAKETAIFAELFSQHLHGIVQVDPQVTELLEATANLLTDTVSELGRQGYQEPFDLATALYRGETDRREGMEERPKVKLEKNPAEFQKKVGQRQAILGIVDHGAKAEGADLVRAVTGHDVANTQDDYTLNHQEKANASKAKHGVVEQGDMAPIFDGIERMLGPRGERDPKVARHLDGLRSDAYKVSWFSKLFFGIHQVAWRNPDIAPLQQFVRLAERINSTRMEIIAGADSIARRWDVMAGKDRDGLADIQFWLTEMNYRSRAEAARGVIRHPTAGELNAEIARLGLSPEAIALLTDVRTSFDTFLDRVEQVLIKNINKKFTDPATNQLNAQGVAAIADLAADMTAMKAKPYFPMTRFGKWTVTVRDFTTGQVKWFSAYPTAKVRDAAVASIANMGAHVGDRMQIGMIGEQSFEFMGLPAPLLRAIKANLPGLTQQQRDWLEQFEHTHAPDQSFKKHWLERKGTPGYSTDAFRTYSHYFLSGANYVSKLEFQDELGEQIKLLRRDIPHHMDGKKLTQIADTMQEAYQWIIEGGKDWARTKSLISIWQLGFSPAAAFMNLTQIPMVAIPFFHGTFGAVQTTKAFTTVMASLKNSFDHVPQGTAVEFQAARKELIRQGKIDVGLAPELGAYAEGLGILNMNSGTKAQRFYRTLSWASMAMFGKAERMNREIVLGMAWEMANDPANVNNAFLQDTWQHHAHEINQLMNVGVEMDDGTQVFFTLPQAIAIIAARTAIDRTQFIYQPWARPTFLRGPKMSVTMIFFSYMQGMLFAFGNNPGAARMLALHAVLYGMMGMPGAEDLSELIGALSRLAGKDFNPQREARELVRTITEGTVLDQVGPDLFLRGVSRYSFGLGLLQEGWGIPQFDASANGSLGRVVPGAVEAFRNIGRGRSVEEIATSFLEDAGGAGFGQMFPMLQFLNHDPRTSDLKKWEKVMPRFGKALSKSYRFYSEGEERTHNHATFAKYDRTDPDDMATILSQAFGFAPRKQNIKWDMLRTSKDTYDWYRARRMALMEQLDEAVVRGTREDMQATVKRIVSFNKEVSGKGFGGMGIKPQGIIQSAKGRARARAMSEMGLPPQKQGIQIQKHIQKLYPDNEAFKVR